MRLKGPSFLLCVASVLLLPACGDEAKQDAPAAGTPPTQVTAADAVRDTLFLREETLGTVQAKQAPTIGSEVAARVLAVHADEGDSVAAGALLAELDSGDFVLARERSAAETKRLEALVENQERQLERNRRMLERSLVAQSVVDDADAELRALRGQLAAERANASQAERNIERTRIVAPLSGRIESRLVDAGDWAAVGTPLFRIATDEVLRAHLPFPEYVAEALRPGLPVRLASPAAPGVEVEGRIAELRPMIGAARAVIVIAEFANPGGWRAGASVNGSVTLEQRPNAVLVPEVSIVQRPAGTVVYVIEGDRVRAQTVRTGIRQGGRIEIVEGLRGDERIVVDGAGFLTGGARVQVREAGA
jgi:RND family efflux transporter MFP subunit